MGKAERETIYVHPQAWYAEHDVDLRLGTRVTVLDPAAHEVTLADGSRTGYAQLLLATGSSPRRLPVPGAEYGRVLYLRRVGDCDQIKAAFAAVSRVAVSRTAGSRASSPSSSPPRTARSAACTTAATTRSPRSLRCST